MRDMNLIFENVSTATFDYDHYHRSQKENLWDNQTGRSHADEPKVTLHEGRKYEAVGESYGGTISFGKRFLHIAAITCMVALGVFLLFVPFFFRGYRELIVDQLKKQSGVSVHHIPLQPRHWQETALLGTRQGLGNGALGMVQLYFEILPHKISTYSMKDPYSIVSVACCIKIAFDGGEVRKQYIFNRGPLQIFNSEVLRKEAQKIEKSLAKSLEEEINLESKKLTVDCVILLKQVKGDIISASQTQQHSLMGRESTEQKQETFEEFDNIDPSVLAEIGFTGECVDPEGNFIEGKYFQKV